ncbi:hypothetical protein [Croceimicrobium hydrocarbonivorans]|uniref:Uncharacterized protein n=1 Tax=Croceimicrobium hydrocarbonivorans TaxID=2761580 RepID=A0A7H0VJ60_9FLAO|nr:hypothetical protein [Croceimicrobium hydrocarbonivorans]QNR25758.1 hypothetical protein H4K34_07920 [Croceimicrobium hydrocarbonivorans]
MKSLLLSLPFIFGLSALAPSSALVVEARLIDKFKLELADETGKLEFLKFQSTETDDIFLLQPDYVNHPKSFYRKNKVYEITYGPGDLWANFRHDIDLKVSDELEYYPLHFLLEIKRL